MQTANITLLLGGDAGMTVPKYGVTPSEIAVLRAIHGEASVRDIEPQDDIERSNREEIRRLNEVYQRARHQTPNGEVGVVATLFPGAGARPIESFADLELPDEFYKAETRAKPKAAEKKAKTSKSKDGDETPSAFD